MNFVLLSDTHCQHDKIDVSSIGGDVLIHAGDFCVNGEVKEAEDFLNWFINQVQRHKVLVAGNHDTIFDKDHAHAREHIRKTKKESWKDDLKRELLGHGVHFLENESAVINGINFYGSPFVRVQHQRSLWGFPIRSNGHAHGLWEQIPSDTDVLVTHSPPAGILDANPAGRNIGCPVLYNEVTKRVKPKLHIFGHCHSNGVVSTEHTTFINASWLNDANQENKRIQKFNYQ